jgi:hypothetical protein
MKIDKTEYVVLDTGTYAATVNHIEKVEGKFGDQLQWDFLLSDGGATQRSWCSMALSPKSKLFAWTKAILGEVPEQLETDAFLGMPCRLTIVVKAREDGTEYNKVDAVLAPKPTQKKRAMPMPELPDDLGSEPLPF